MEPKKQKQKQKQETPAKESVAPTLSSPSPSQDNKELKAKREEKASKAQNLFELLDKAQGTSSHQPVNAKAGSSAEPSPKASNVATCTLAQHSKLLYHPPEQDDLNEVETAPIFTEKVRKHTIASGPSPSNTVFTQYGLLASSDDIPDVDPRVFYNVAAPSSVFICGSQGSGKSHTLSCLVENCLVKSDANLLPRPLTGLVFHYDNFVSDRWGAACEASYLSSHKGVEVRLLCAPSNIQIIKQIYKREGISNITVEELRINEFDLDTQRMLDLMAVSDNGPMPLYLHVVKRILREMRVRQQENGTRFSYTEFKTLIEDEAMTREQQGPLKQRLDTLESFMVNKQIKPESSVGKKKAKHKIMGTDWTPKVGRLTIVDLSCPCVTADMACSLFNICLSLFLEQDSTIGRVIALDEAHKYMGDSAEAKTLTTSLTNTIRLQRHVGARIIVSTQEPTISPVLLDLCSVTIVHRFSSPAWLTVLKGHVAGAAAMPAALKMGDDDDREGKEGAGDLFSRIVGLKVGEALLFAPSAMIGVTEGKKSSLANVQRLNQGVLQVRVRNRVTTDGGKSVMAG